MPKQKKKKATRASSKTPIGKLERKLEVAKLKQKRKEITKQIKVLTPKRKLKK